MSQILRGSLLRCLPFIIIIPLALVVIPCSFLLYLPFLIYRQLVIQWVALFNRDTLGKILTTRSSLLIADKITTSPRFALVSFMVLEGVVDIDHFRTVFQQRILELLIDPEDVTGPGGKTLRYPELSQGFSYFGGFGFWKKLDSIDIRELIYFYNDDEIGPTTCETASDFTKKLCFKPFPKDKPLWEMVVYPNFIPDPNITSGILPNTKYTGVSMRCHHGLADGFSQFRAFQAMSTLGDTFKYIKPSDYTNKKSGNNNQAKSCCSGFARNVALVCKMLFELSQAIVRTPLLLEDWNEVKNRNFKKVQLDKNRKSNQESDDLLNACNDKPTKYLSRFSCDPSRNFPITEISGIKKAHCVSGTAVLYSAIVAAARNTIFSDKIPENVLVVTPLPLPGASGKLRNHITMGAVIVPFSEENPIKRLLEMDKKFQNLKNSTMPLVNAIMMKAVGALPSFLVYFILGRIYQSTSFITVSNLAGPTTPIDFGGYPVLDFLFSSGASVGTNVLTVSLLSVSGNIRVGVGADKQIIESDEKCQEFTENFFKELTFYKNSINFETSDSV